MKSKFFAIPMIAMGLMAGGAQVASSTSSVNMLLNITSNTGSCSVSPSAASFNLPNGTATLGMQDWMKAAGFTQTAPTSPAAFIAGTAFDQTVSITCAQPNTMITSILVAPAAGTLTNGSTSIAYMLDSSGNKLAGGDLNTSAELVSITSQSGTLNKYFAFQTSDAGPQLQLAYATPFMTSTALNSANLSTASFVWHPVLWAGSNAAMGNPVGGSFKTPWTVTVNY